MTNLLFLPSLLLSLDRAITTKAFKDQDPMIELFDEEVDIDLDDLHIAVNENDNTKGEELESEPEKPEG